MAVAGGHALIAANVCTPDRIKADRQTCSEHFGQRQLHSSDVGRAGTAVVRVRPVLQAGQAYPSRRTRVPPVRSFDRLKSIWPMKSEIIFYARVSTRRQGKSGLGLSAQRKAVQAFADAEAFQNR